MDLFHAGRPVRSKKVKGFDKKLERVLEEFDTRT